MLPVAIYEGTHLNGPDTGPTEVASALVVTVSRMPPGWAADQFSTACQVFRLVRRAPENVVWRLDGLECSLVHYAITLCKGKLGLQRGYR